MEKKNKNILALAVISIVEVIRTLFLIPHGVCKYHPSCTVYAKEALSTYPLHRAICLVLKRVFKCNPFTKGGYDPLVKNK